jgi:hypothetical protein
VATHLRSAARRPSAGLMILVVLVLTLSGAIDAFAQESDRPLPIADIAKRVVLDPTTFAPAVIAYDATLRDWKTSQVFFENGFLESNPRFTISGRPYDMPVGYAAGQRRILLDAMTILGNSAVHNISANIIERLLVSRYPNHRKLFRVLGWAERSAYASYMSYALAAPHYRQSRFNQQQAVLLGRPK